jgi:hypothetical protein
MLKPVWQLMAGERCNTQPRRDDVGHPWNVRDKRAIGGPSDAELPGGLRRELTMVLQPPAEAIECIDLPIENYIERIFRPMDATSGAFVAENRRILLDHIREFAAADGRDLSALSPADTALTIQSGPHSVLAFTPQTFLASAITDVGCRANGQTLRLVFQVSAVTLTEAPKEGPGWLRLAMESVNLFDMSRKGLRQSACAANGRVSLVRLIDYLRAAGALNPGNKRLFDQLAEIEDNSIAACLLRANRAIVTDLLEVEPGRLEIIDGDFLAGLTVRHLRQSSGIGRILALPAAVSILHCIGSEPNAAENARAESLLFWSMRRGRIQPCQHVGADIVDADGVVCDGANPNSVIEALEERRLTPRLFLTHLLLSIVTNHRVIGGLRQLRYYPGMYDRTVEWLRKFGAPDWADELELRHGWGHFLWSKPLLTAEHLINGTAVSDILRQHLNMSLREASEDLRAFRTAN